MPPGAACHDRGLSRRRPGPVPAKAGIVLEVVAIVFQRVEILVFYFPGRSPAGGQFRHVALVHGQIRHQAVVESELARRIDNLDLEPVDDQRVIMPEACLRHDAIAAAALAALILSELPRFAIGLPPKPDRRDTLRTARFLFRIKREGVRGRPPSSGLKGGSPYALTYSVVR